VTHVGAGSPSGMESAMPVTDPDAPTQVALVAGNAQITASFAAPGDTGGMPTIE